MKAPAQTKSRTTGPVAEKQAQQDPQGPVGTAPAQPTPTSRSRKPQHQVENAEARAEQPADLSDMLLTQSAPATDADGAMGEGVVLTSQAAEGADSAALEATAAGPAAALTPGLLGWLASGLTLLTAAAAGGGGESNKSASPLAPVSERFNPNLVDGTVDVIKNFDAKSPEKSLQDVLVLSKEQLGSGLLPQDWFQNVKSGESATGYVINLIEPASPQGADTAQEVVQLLQSKGIDLDGLLKPTLLVINDGLDTYVWKHTPDLIPTNEPSASEFELLVRLDGVQHGLQAHNIAIV